MKILLNLQDKLVKDIDSVCSFEGYDRSEYIRMCIRASLYGMESTVTTNKEVAKIVKETSTTPVKISGTETPLTITKGQKITEEVDGYMTEWTWEWCHGNVAHEFTKGKLFKCQMATYKDKDDNVGMISGKKYDHVYICMDCLVYLEKQIQEGGFEYGR